MPEHREGLSQLHIYRIYQKLELQEIPWAGHLTLGGVLPTQHYLHLLHLEAKGIARSVSAIVSH
jgi:hypothetical protein